MRYWHKCSVACAENRTTATVMAEGDERVLHLWDFPGTLFDNEVFYPDTVMHTIQFDFDNDG